jgi:hypothetical protein
MFDLLLMEDLRKMKTYYLLSVLLLTTCMAFGCAVTGQRRSRHARLSEAMEKASDNHSGDRRIETATRRPYEPRPHRIDAPHRLHDRETLETASPAAPLPSPGKEKEPWLIGLSAGYGVIRGDDIYQLNQVDLSVGGYLDEHQRLEGFVGIGYPLIDETADLNSSIDDIWFVNLGGCYKYFTTPRHTFLGHYFIVGLAFTQLYWSYENAIQLDDETIRNDSLQGLELFAGMGLNLAQTERFQLGLEALPSMTLWESQTDKGFDNDVFGNFYTVKVRLTASLLF